MAPRSDTWPRTPATVLAAAQRLLDEGRPFAAHEVLEEAWKRATGDERSFWRGLTQLAVALTHRQRGNVAGERALLDRARATLADQEGRHGVAVGAALAAAASARHVQLAPAVEPPVEPPVEPQPS
ncbi:MAG: DUF309 domain-containing protein [Mycobacteriales bacterium]